MGCFVDGWMTESKKKAHLNLLDHFKLHTRTIVKLGQSQSPEGRARKDRKKEYEKERKIRQNTWIDSRPKSAPRQRGFGE